MQAVILYLPRNSVRTGRCVFAWTGVYHVAMHLPLVLKSVSKSKRLFWKEQ